MLFLKYEKNSYYFVSMKRFLQQRLLSIYTQLFPFYVALLSLKRNYSYNVKQFNTLFFNSLDL
jgi:hypothetical protein